MPPLSLLIKPASSNCNLRCKYCFYFDTARNREIPSYGLMSEETIEVILQKALAFADHSCTVAFQGGEPMLAGLDFFRRVVELESKYNTKNIKIYNAIQTNGFTIDDEWAVFLSENKFLTGISLDGPRDIHDMNRLDISGNGSFNKVLKAVSLLDKYKVDYNVLCVVNALTARHISKIYSFCKKNGFRHLQFIPCLDPLNEVPGGREFSLLPERYADFLKTLFDLWYEDISNNNMISIRYFDNLVGMYMGYPPEACDMNGHCTCQFVMEADGSVFPCDFYVLDEWKLGNIRDMDFGEMKHSQRCRTFEDMSLDLDPKCRQCQWRQLCRGGCRRYREQSGDGKATLNYYCSSYSDFFSYADRRLRQIASRYRR